MPMILHVMRYHTDALLYGHNMFLRLKTIAKVFHLNANGPLSFFPDCQLPVLSSYITMGSDSWTKHLLGCHYFKLFLLILWNGPF